MTTTSLADGAISFTNLIGKLAGAGTTALPVVHFIAQWVPVPYLAQIDAALQLAAPYIAKISQAAPVIAKAIDKDGRPALDAIQAHAPDLLADIKAVYAIAVNHDPMRPETSLTASGVSDATAAAYASQAVFTPGRTNAEQQREWDRDKQSMG